KGRALRRRGPRRGRGGGSAGPLHEGTARGLGCQTGYTEQWPSQSGSGVRRGAAWKTWPGAAAGELDGDGIHRCRGRRAELLHLDLDRGRRRVGEDALDQPLRQGLEELVGDGRPLVDDQRGELVVIEHAGAAVRAGQRRDGEGDVEVDDEVLREASLGAG